jgi:hypothetical protein
MYFKNVVTQESDSSSSFGYDAAWGDDNKKYYKAWASAGKERIESETYEACDDADMPQDLRKADIEEVRYHLERVEQLRKAMTAKQRSRQDMMALAESLMKQAIANSAQRKKNDDERFAKSVQILNIVNFLEPLTYIKKYGTDEQKAVLKSIIQQIEEL